MTKKIIRPTLTTAAQGGMLAFYLLIGSSAYAEPEPETAAAESPKCVVTGRVTGPDGAGLDGATIEWGGRRESFQARQRVTTDQDGNYRITLDSLDGNHHFAASAPGYQAKVANSAFAHGEFRRDFQLKPLSKYRNVASGVVLDPRGKPVPGVRVEALTPVVGFYSSFSMPTGRDYFPGPDRVSTTDEQGRFRIADLTTDQVMLNLRSAHRHVNDKNYPVRNLLEITINYSGKPGFLQAQLVDAATGQPVSGLHGLRVIRRHRTEVHQRIDDQGRFRLPDVATRGDRVSVYVYARGYAAKKARIKAVAKNSQSYARVSLKQAPAFEGRLIDAKTGLAIAGAKLLYGIADDARYFEWGSFDRYTDDYHSMRFVQHATSDDNGRFWFCEPEGGSLGVIVGLADGYQRLVLWPNDREKDESNGQVVVRLKQESAVTGVAMKNGKPVAKEKVTVSNPAGYGWEGYSADAVTDDQGRYRVGKLPPGDYWVRAVNCSCKVSVRPFATHTVTLGTDPGALRIFGQAPRGYHIYLAPQFEWERESFQTVANSAGEYELKGLKAGKYRVRLNDPNSGMVGDLTPRLEIEVSQDAQRINLTAPLHAGGGS